ncbi:MAG: hypothetical protein O3B02_00590 [Proteobacteria bacterium]|nr:hypothetical protein [Pseudomonadota bacterium]MDA0895754.1 hypothetical protein [Pseudomonadota bacterium]MDA1243479.1 hypothetical protein [Pseudomonadota bacterium]
MQAESAAKLLISSVALPIVAFTIMRDAERGRIEVELALELAASRG